MVYVTKGVGGGGQGAGLRWWQGVPMVKPIFALETISKKKLSNSDMLWPEY